MELTDFILARISEEEFAWQELGARHRDFDKSARAGMARCADKRSLVQRYLEMGSHGLLVQLQELALPYYDHPAYQREWLPRGT